MIASRSQQDEQCRFGRKIHQDNRNSPAFGTAHRDRGVTAIHAAETTLSLFHVEHRQEVAPVEEGAKRTGIAARKALHEPAARIYFDKGLFILPVDVHDVVVHDKACPAPAPSPYPRAVSILSTATRAA